MGASSRRRSAHVRKARQGEPAAARGAKEQSRWVVILVVFLDYLSVALVVPQVSNVAATSFLFPDRAALRTHFTLPLERGDRFSGSGAGQGES